MEIEQLQYVIEIARLEHFTQAADKICLSQSALSKQVAKLEDELGVQLFDRTTRKVRLTPAGEEFLSYAKRILQEIEYARAAMTEHCSLNRGRITIGAIPVIGQLGLTAALVSFQQKHPGVQMKIRENETLSLLNWLYQAEIDIAFIATGKEQLSSNNIINVSPLFNDKIVLVTSESHLFAERTTVRVEDLTQEKMILMNHESGMHKICLDACHNAGFEPLILYECSQLDTILGLVQEGIGVTMLTSRVANAFTQFRVKKIELEPLIERSISLVMQKQAHISPVVKAFHTHMFNWVEAKC